MTATCRKTRKKQIPAGLRRTTGGRYMRDDLTMEHNTQGGSTVSLRPLLGWENNLPVWARTATLKPTVQFQGGLYSRWNPRYDALLYAGEQFRLWR